MGPLVCRPGLTVNASMADQLIGSLLRFEKPSGMGRGDGRTLGRHKQDGAGATEVLRYEDVSSAGAEVLSYRPPKLLRVGDPDDWARSYFRRHVTSRSTQVAGRCGRDYRIPQERPERSSCATDWYSLTSLSRDPVSRGPVTRHGLPVRRWLPTLHALPDLEQRALPPPAPTWPPPSETMRRPCIRDGNAREDPHT